MQLVVVSRLLFLVLLGIAVVPSAEAAKSEFEQGGNPMRRIISMLQAMQSKVEEERAAEKVIYEKAMCVADEAIGHLEKKVDDATKLIPELESSIEEGTGTEAQLKSELAEHKEDQKELNTAMQDASKMREKENKVFKSESSESKANIKACKAAYTKIEEGLADAAFLQTDDARVLRKAVMASSTISEFDRASLVAFLSNQRTETGAGTAGSGEIVGMLKQLHKDMIQDLKDMVEEEEKAVRNYEDLMAAKGKQAAEVTTAIETKTAQLAQVSQQLVDDKALLKQTQSALELDTEELIFEKKARKKKTEEYEALMRGISIELNAIAETMKMLNNDDAMNLFKKTMAHPGAGGAPLSFLQSRAASRLISRVEARGLAFLRQAPATNGPADHVARKMVALAVKNRAAGFKKVLTMIDDMVTLLGQEQEKDAEKKEYCDEQLAQAGDKKEQLQGDIEDTKTVLASTTDSITELKERIAGLKADVTSLDEEVRAATAVRKKEKAEFQVLMADNLGAIQLIEMAKEKMSVFLTPPSSAAAGAGAAAAAALAQEQPSRPAAAQEPAAAPTTPEEAGMEAMLAAKQQAAPAAPPAAPPAPPQRLGKESSKMEEMLEEAVSFVQVGSRRTAQLESAEKALEQVAEDDGIEVAREAFGEDTTTEKAAQSVLHASPESKDMGGGIIKMFDEVKADLEKEVATGKEAEKIAQADFDTFLEMQNAKRKQDQRSIVKVSGKLATAEEEHQQHTGVKEDREGELGATKEFLGNLHVECDTLLENFDMRKTARQNEIDGLTRAKAVLAGADDTDVTFLQTRATVQRHMGASLRR